MNKIQKKWLINKNGYPSEELEQMNFFKWVELQQVVRRTDNRYNMIFAVPNGDLRAKSVASRLKRTGVRAGIPDIFVDVPSGKYHGLRIEMKTQKGGVVSDKQKEYLALYELHGYKAVVCKGCDEAINTVEKYFQGEIDE